VAALDRAPAAATTLQFLAYLFAGATLAVMFPLVAFNAPAFALRSGHEHALLDLGIALSACFCSLQALVRYQSRPQALFLWLGAGFLASGLLDGLHAMLSLEAVAPGDLASRAGAVTWSAGSLVLAIYLLLSLGPERPLLHERVRRFDPLLVGITTVALLTLLGFLLIFRTSHVELGAIGPLQRPNEMLAGLAMLAVIPALWWRHSILDAPLLRRLAIALPIYVVLHIGVAAWSVTPTDTYSGAAHLARFLAHWLVLVGLLQSSANLLTDAEASRKRLAVQTDELEASERHVRSILNHAPYAILSAGQDGVVRNINPVAVQMFGIPEPQAVGRPLQSFFDDSLQAELAATLGPSEQATRARLLQLRQRDSGDETSRSRWALSRQARGIRGDGTPFPIALTLTDTISGGHRFFTAFVRDLTQTIQQEQRTQQALMLATRILDQSSVAIWSTDGAGLITRFNNTAQQWLGYSEIELKGRRTAAVFLDPEDIRARAKTLEREQGIPASTDVEVMLAVARRGEAHTQEWLLVSKDGRRIPASLSVSRLTTDGGEVTGFVMVATDLSQQKEIEKLKNEFVSNVSHELRTPLTSIRGSLGLLAGGLAGKLPGQAQGLLEIAQRNTERLILLINDILDIEKIEAGKMRFAFKSVDLDALVGDAVQGAEGMAQLRSVRLVRRQRAAGLRVHVDEHRLLQVATNLLSNAIKFSPEGGSVEIDVVADGGRARVTVTDHGGGIPEASQSRIFQKFFQADSSATREKGGTGLGLSICKALIERMDGDIGFRSRPGETVFHFGLPLEASTGDATRARRVLVVEDDADVSAILCQILRQTGLETETASSAAQARQLLQDRRYDCMLLDILLPDQDGFALLTQLRQQEHGRQLPVIVVSVYEADRARMQAANVADWLTKPIDGARLLAAVRKVLPAIAERGVLLVEDDAALSEMLRKLLADTAPVTVAPSLAQGRAEIERRSFSLVILDLKLPDGNGSDLLPLLQRSQPRTPIVVFTEAEAQDLAGKVTRVLSKSRTGHDELLRVVQELMQTAAPAAVARAN
jgi:PAS domain S-box-containing protein